METSQSISPQGVAQLTPNPPTSAEDSATPAHPPAASSGPRLNPRSCVTCRRRKVRCNKQNPCANCVRAGIECVFPGPGRAPRKSRKPPDTELLARLQRLEGVVHSLGAQVDEHGVVSPTLAGPTDIRARFGDGESGESPSSDRSDTKRQSIEKHLGRLVINEDRSRYVSSTFWTSMSEEIAEMRDLLDPSSSDDEDEAVVSRQDRADTHNAFIFGYSSAMLDLRELHPTPSQIFILWEVFKENVDPVVRISHRPTTRAILMNATTSLDRLSKPAEALLFSIYFGAVVSLSPEQCQQLLDESKESLIKKYRFATEQALARADFLNSSSLMCLQAFAFFLIFVRYCDDSRKVWALGGLAIHLAQGLGIHRDGSHFGLGPFETEMRRRLWWYLSILDIRSAEDHGTDPAFAEQIYDTKLPLNYDDEDIYPGMKEYPPERPGATEMTFCLIRFELSTFSRRLNSMSSRGEDGQSSPESTLMEKERLIDEYHRRVEEKYLRHCDMNVPIFWVAATVARLMLAKIWLMVHHPRSFSPTNHASVLPPESRDRVFVTSVEVIEFSHLLQKHENTAKWGWLFQTYTQWQSIAYALSEICARPPGPDVDRAWRAIDAVFADQMLMNNKFQKGVAWKPLRHLMAKARARRAAQQAQASQTVKDSDMTSSNVPSSTSPDRPMHDYPYTANPGAMEAFGMGNLPAYSNHAGQQPMQGTTEGGMAGQGTSQEGQGTTDWTPDDSGLPDSGILEFDWSASLGDFSGQPDPFSRFVVNAQEEWF
ncbi:hypothetical protein A1O1_06649 [Capronia coronata CBS 617.96]|uniref:Zn(2)-C6 fungal-type domain-containing protein n=1 Tax=Capronia coronata CBS 617.96 TaxID=1182541 RepID=W9YVH4_9EURO|nr:uncharacterized protein A1O1_06649 [Capronia coronata CBS 617.96]EXJ86279.1 hypothetical protein A1O1_06649 [Capronia coronata CBS 617.96]